jgi:hypothetical protein
MKIDKIALLIVVLHFHSYGQQNASTHDSVFPQGINIDYGLGHFSVKDDFFSRERYSGTLPYFTIGWSRFHDEQGIQLCLNYRSSSEIKNNQFPADVVQFSFELDYLYSAGTFSLCSQNVHAYLGPSVEFFTYYNRQHFASDGIFLDFSFATLLSLGVHPMFVVPLRDRLQLESSMQINAFSVVVRMPQILKVDPLSNDESRLKLLTPFSGLNARMNVGARYYLFKTLSLKLRYEFHVTRLTSWEYLLSASDDVIATVNYHL